MSDEKFGPLVAFTDIEDAVLAHYEKWMETWLSARERRKGIIPGTIARPRSYIIKQVFTALPGQEQTPLIVAVCDGFRQETYRRGDGSHLAYLRFGIAAMCMASGPNSVRSMVGHYQAAIVGIALKHRKVNDEIQLAEFNDLKIDDTDEEAVGRSMAAVRIELTYAVQNFVEEFDPPDLLPDPLPPQDDSPEVLSVHVEVEEMA